MPCPEKLDVAAILRFHTLYATYGLTNWAKKLYNGLEVDVTNCTECGECEPKCPYSIPIMSVLKEAHDVSRALVSYGVTTLNFMYHIT